MSPLRLDPIEDHGLLGIFGLCFKRLLLTLKDVFAAVPAAQLEDNHHFEHYTEGSQDAVWRSFEGWSDLPRYMMASQQDKQCHPTAHILGGIISES